MKLTEEQEQLLDSVLDLLPRKQRLAIVSKLNESESPTKRNAQQEGSTNEGQDVEAESAELPDLPTLPPPPYDERLSVPQYDYSRYVRRPPPRRRSKLVAAYKRYMRWRAAWLHKLKTRA